MLDDGNPIDSMQSQGPIAEAIEAPDLSFQVVLLLPPESSEIFGVGAWDSRRVADSRAVRNVDRKVPGERSVVSQKVPQNRCCRQAGHFHRVAIRKRSRDLLEDQLEHVG